MDKRKIITVFVTALLILGLVVLIPSSPVTEEVSGETSTVSMALAQGWNLKGMPKVISASEICGKSTYVTSVVRRTSGGNYETYVDFLQTADFTCQVNEGVYIWAEQVVTITFTVDLEATSGYTRGDLWIDGNLAVAENVTLDNNLNVNGTMTITGTFSANDLNVVGNLTVDGELTTQGNLTVGGSITIVGDMSVGDNLFVDGDSNVTGNSTVGGYLSVDGNATFGNDLTVNGNFTVLGTYFVEEQGFTNLTVNNLTILGNVSGLGLIDPANYVVYKAEGSIYGKNMSSGSVEFQSTNATYVIQSSLDGCPTGVGVVEIKDGTYDIIDTINISYGKTLVGAGMGRDTFGTLLDWIGSGTKDIIIYNGDGVSQNTQRRGNGIYSLTVDGNDVAGSTGIRTRNSFEHIIENVFVKNTGSYGIVIEGSFTEILNYVQTTLTGDAGVYITDYSAQTSTGVRIDKCDLSRSVNYNLLVDAGTNVVVSDTWFENGAGDTGVHLGVDGSSYTTNTVIVYGSSLGGLRDATECVNIFGGYSIVTMNNNRITADGNDESAVNMSHGELHFKDNFVKCGGDYALKITADTVIALIQNNRFEAGGISDTSSSGQVQIQDNKFWSIVTDYAIYTTNDYAYAPISGNTITNAEKHGIYSTAKYGLITNNELFDIGQGTDNTYNGITITDDNNVVSGNIIVSKDVDKMQYGIGIYKDNNIVTNNFIEGAGTYDIWEAAGRTDNIIKNNHLVDGTALFRGGEGSIYKDNIGFINQTIHIGKDLHVGGNLSVDGGITVGGNISVTGNMEVTGNLTVTGDIIGATGRNVDFVVVASDAPQHWLNQGDYFCDGSDDQVEINVAFENCSVGWGKVVLSGGTFDISDTINISYGVTLEGAGGGKTDNQISTWLSWSGSGTKDIITYNYVGATHTTTRRSGAGIFKLTVDGNSIAGSTGIRVRNSMHHYIQDVQVKDCAERGIVIEASFDQHILNSQINNCDNDGIYLTDYGGNKCTWVEIQGCEFQSASTDDYHIRILSGQRTYITKCYFENTASDSAVFILIDDTQTGEPNVWIEENSMSSIQDGANFIIVDGGKVYVNRNSLQIGSTDRQCILMSSGYLQAEGNDVFHGGAADGHFVKITGGDYALIKGNYILGGSSGDYSIKATGMASLIISDNIFNRNGIYTEVNGTVITGNRFAPSYAITSKNTIHLNATNCTFSNNVMNTVYYTAVYVSQPYCKISGNILTELSRQSNGVYDGIVINASNCQVIDNTLYSMRNEPRYGILVYNANYTMILNNYVKDTATYDIHITSGSENCSITGNTFPDGTVSISGSNHIVRDNIGFVTENWGYNASITNGFTVTHGLAGTPTSITITLGQNGTVWITAKDATTFTVGLPAGTYDIYWYAIYRP